jgi:MinD superfamily P-loop ATPase
VKQVTVISGKGGTGKTSLVASLARLAAPLVTADCDVDAANLALLLPGLDGVHAPFYSGRQASIDPRLCQGCGLCQQACRFRAVAVEGAGPARLNPFACEGCGACVLVCPEQALELVEKLVGVWTVRPAETGPLVHAMLGVAQDNSGKLVSRVREEAARAARAEGLELVLIDGPPGIGCPVQAAVGGVDLVLAVTEPTSSGEHDLSRVLDLARQSRIPAAVVINKADLDPQARQRIESLAAEAGAPVLGRLPFDREVPLALARGELPLAVPAMAGRIERIWAAVQDLLVSDPGPAEAPAVVAGTSQIR